MRACNVRICLQYSSIPLSSEVACQPASLRLDEIVQHTHHTGITFVSSGHTLSSQSVPLRGARRLHRRAGRMRHEPHARQLPQTDCA